MHCVLGYTVQETAAATGSPLNTVRGRLVSAKAALRQRLDREVIPDPEATDGQPTGLLKQTFPFGPALAAGAMVAVLFSDTLLT